MKIIEKRSIDTVVDKKCDVCDESLIKNISGVQLEESAVFKANWGFGSKQDGNHYHLNLCENCFMTALHALKDKRRAVVMFSDNDVLPDNNFGLDLTRTKI